MAFCLQMSGWQGAQSLHANAGKAVVYTGMVDCFMQTVREEGFKALFKVQRKLLFLILSLPLCYMTLSFRET